MNMSIALSSYLGESRRAISFLSFITTGNVYGINDLKLYQGIHATANTLGIFEYDGLR